MFNDVYTGSGGGEAVRLADLITLREARALLPTRNGRRVDISAVYRWVQHGLDGVKLRTVKVGGVKYTCEAWLWEFFNREQEGTPSSAAPDAEAFRPALPWRTRAQARRDLERARQALRERGPLRG